MNHIFKQAISDVNRAYPSIYTKEDVVKLLENLQFVIETVEEERKVAASIPYEDIIETLSDIKVAIRNHVKEMDFAEFVELELGYDNQIEIHVDQRGIEEDIEAAFEEIVVTLVAAPTEK